MNFLLPSTTLKDRDFEMGIITSRFPEFPLLSLGFHSLLSKARDRLLSVVELSGVQEFLKYIHPYYFEEENDSLFLEIRETMAENELLSKGIKSCLVVTSHTDITRAFKGFFPASGVKTIDANNIVSKMKKGFKTNDLLFITGVENSVCSLALACSGNHKNVCIRLSEYPVFSTNLKLIDILAACFDKVSIFKPKVVSPFQVQGVVYIVAIKRKATADVQPIIDAIIQANGKMNIIDILPMYRTSPKLEDELTKANVAIIGSDISAIESMYKFVKAKDYYGTVMNGYKAAQLEKSKEWRKKYM